MLTIEIFHARQWIEQHHQWDTTSEVVAEWPIVVVHVAFIGKVNERLVKVVWYQTLGGRGNSMKKLPDLLREAWKIAKIWKERTKIAGVRIVETGHNHYNDLCVSDSTVHWIDTNTIANIHPESVLPDRRFLSGV